MRTLEYSIWLLQQWYGFLMYFGFTGLITVPLGLTAIVVFGKVSEQESVNHRRLAIAAIAPGAITLFMLLLGVVFVHDFGDVRPMIPGVPPGSVLTFIWILWLLQFALDTKLAAWAGKDTGRAVFCTSLWWGWVSFCAAIVSGMSIRGDGF